MRLFILLSLLVATIANATTYYVRTDGNNGNSGTADNAGGAWLTVQKSATTVVSGDTVYVRAGTFNEFITFSNSGTAVNPITFIGSGTNTTIIDPSTAFTNGWVAAAEIGAGVWKQTNMTFAARELSIAAKRVMGVWTPGALGATFYTNALTTGSQLLSAATDLVVKFPDSDFSSPFEFWDGIEALWSATNEIGGNYTCYLRLRDGSDPNGLDIRAAPNNNVRVSDSDVYAPGLTFSARSYIVLSNFWIRGAVIGVYLNNSHHITLRGNLFSGSYNPIRIYGNSRLNEIVGNEFTDNFYGGNTLGAWSHNGTRTTQYNVWTLSKFAMNPDWNCMARPIYFLSAGNSNIVANNTIHHTIGDGIPVYGSATYIATNSLIYSNTVAHCVDAGIRVASYNVGTKVFDNLIQDCEVNFRPHQFDTSGDTRSVYVYRNRFYDPDNTGEHIYFHFYGDGADSYGPTNWFYQNSFSGGYCGFTVGEIGSTGLTNVHVLNNIFNTNRYAFCYSSGLPWWTNATKMGSFDYNVITLPSPGAAPAWFGVNNISSSTNIWTSAEDMSYALLAGCVAIDAGEDLPTDFPALPQDGTTKAGAEWDIGALEYDGAAITVAPASHDYGTQQVGSTTDFNFSVTNTGEAGSTLAGTATTTGQFSVQAPASYSLAEGASQNITVRYAPASAGSHSATVTFTGGVGATTAVSGVATNYVLPSPPRTLTVGRIQRIPLTSYLTEESGNRLTNELGSKLTGMR